MILALLLAAAQPSYIQPDRCAKSARVITCYDRAKRIERQLLSFGFAPYDAWYDSLYLTPAERNREIELFYYCGRDGANDDDGVNFTCDGFDMSAEQKTRAAREYRACGPEGVDSDTTPGPPRCNRKGWNPRTHRYEERTKR